MFWQSDKWGRFGRLGKAGLGKDKNKQLDRFHGHLSGAFGGAEFGTSSGSSSSSGEEEGLFGNLHKHQHGKQASGKKSPMGAVPTIDVLALGRFLDFWATSETISTNVVRKVASPEKAKNTIDDKNVWDRIRSPFKKREKVATQGLSGKGNDDGEEDAPVGMNCDCHYLFTSCTTFEEGFLHMTMCIS
jgi:hypothetical protein